MKTTDINTTLIKGYLNMLQNLSPNNKLDLISKLTLSVKTDFTKTDKKFYNAFGAWESRQTAEEIIKDIYESRSFNRKQETF